MGRNKLIADEDLLSTAREVFIEKGIGASTREIAKRAGISEAVIYQRHPTKSDLFFAAMVPPALDVEELLRSATNKTSVRRQLEAIATSMLQYFRELVPMLLPLISHPSFKFEEFVERHPDSPLGSLRAALVEFLEKQQSTGDIQCENPGMAGLTLFAAMHSLALFERLGIHGGNFDSKFVSGIVQTIWQGIAPNPEE